MKKLSLYLCLSVGFISFFFVACTRINESTDVGGELIPTVDNVNTFETNLAVNPSRYFIANDSTKYFFSDLAALGRMNDPVFGTTNANIYFNLSLQAYGAYPFINRDSVVIDSVVLSLSYRGSYGDTSAGTQTVRVFEISPAANFRTDTAYKFTDKDFSPNGIELGSKTFFVNRFADSTTLIRRRDTVKVNNVLRIPLTNQLGQRFTSFDTTNTSNGGFRNDSLFRSLFRGVAIQTQSFSGNGALSYFDLNDRSKTNLTVYFRATKNGVIDTSSLMLFHLTNGQANIINRQNGGEYGAFASTGMSPDGKLYIQSTPGSYATLKIPGLDTFSNKVIHRAELIVHRLPSALDKVFTPPSRLFLEKINNSGDSAFLFQNDVPLGNDGSVGFQSFGGTLRTDNTYRFTLTRHVQGIISRKEVNLPFRLSAPLRTSVFLPGFTSPISLPINTVPAHGRVVVAGGNYVNPSQAMRLRIIYSNL